MRLRPAGSQQQARENQGRQIPALYRMRERRHSAARAIRGTKSGGTSSRGAFPTCGGGCGAAVQWCALGGQDQMCGRYANHPIRLQDLKWLISASSGAACFIAKNGDVGEHKDGGEEAPRVSTSPRGQLRGKAQAPAVQVRSRLPPLDSGEPDRPGENTRAQCRPGRRPWPPARHGRLG